MIPPFLPQTKTKKIILRLYQQGIFQLKDAVDHRFQPAEHFQKYRLYAPSELQAFFSDGIDRKNRGWHLFEMSLLLFRFISCYFIFV
ncbi:MAG: hypothetical protein ACLTSZ_08160 [Lachnospiraceae bacterium]